MGTFLVGAALAVVVALVIRSMVKDKRNGKSIQCGGDCKYCGGHWRTKRIVDCNKTPMSPHGDTTTSKSRLLRARQFVRLPGKSTPGGCAAMNKCPIMVSRFLKSRRK